LTKGVPKHALCQPLTTKIGILLNLQPMHGEGVMLILPTEVGGQRKNFDAIEKETFSHLEKVFHALEAGH
jgi:hypothetical protein